MMNLNGRILFDGNVFYAIGICKTTDNEDESIKKKLNIFFDRVLIKLKDEHWLLTTTLHLTLLKTFNESKSVIFRPTTHLLMRCFCVFLHFCSLKYVNKWQPLSLS